MKTINYLYKGLAPLDNLIALASKDDLLYFDIETTGLSRKNNHIYLIGAGFYSTEGLNIIQWFAEDESEELLILKEFISFSSSFIHLVNYNGKSFDIPFTNERLTKYGLDIIEFNSIDIYTYIKPFKSILSLDDLTQKTIERFLSINREDKYNGGELIPVYKKYVLSKDSVAYEKLLLHNKEDVLNMHYLTKILDFCKLEEIELRHSEATINKYTDYSGNLKTELIINGLHNFDDLPKCFNTFKSTEYGPINLIFSQNGKFSIRVPIIEETLYYYIDNYKDYYYLINEGICILKSMAGGVLKENRVNATRETCKIAHKNSFIPLLSASEFSGAKVFKDNYKSKKMYIRIDNYNEMTSEEKDKYFLFVYKYLFI